MTTPSTVPYLVAALVAFLIIFANHYFGLWLWRQITRKPMPALVRYITGTLAIHLPLAGLCLAIDGAGALAYIIAAIVCVTAAGVATFICYGIDHATSKYNTASEKAQLA